MFSYLRGEYITVTSLPFGHVPGFVVTSSPSSCPVAIGFPNREDSPVSSPPQP